MQVVQSQRATGRIFIFENFCYSLNKRGRGGSLVLKCEVPTCEGGAKYYEGDEDMEVTTEHSHAADDGRVSFLLARQFIIDQALITTLDYNEIHAECSVRLVGRQAVTIIFLMCLFTQRMPFCFLSAFCLP